MVKLYQTLDISSGLSVIEPSLICKFLSPRWLIIPSDLPITLRIFSSHQVELLMTIPHPFSSNAKPPWLLRGLHESVEERYSGVSKNILVLQLFWWFISKHPTGTVTVNFMEIISPSLSSCEKDEGYIDKKNAFN